LQRTSTALFKTVKTTGIDIGLVVDQRARRL
jgi:hypothetical protein